MKKIEKKFEIKDENGLVIGEKVELTIINSMGENFAKFIENKKGYKFFNKLNQEISNFELFYMDLPLEELKVKFKYSYKVPILDL